MSEYISRYLLCRSSVTEWAAASFHEISSVFFIGQDT
jgi:hypothetical protein